MSEFIDMSSEGSGSGGWLGNAVAITVALVATLMAISKTIDDNIVQEILAYQTTQSSAWAYYQANSVKEHFSKTENDRLKIMLVIDKPSAEGKKLIEKSIAENEKEIIKYEKIKKEQQKLAGEDSKRILDKDNHQDDLFDRSDALLSMTIAFLAMSALTKKKWLYFAGVGVFVVGAVLFAFAYWFTGYVEAHNWLQKILAVQWT